MDFDLGNLGMMFGAFQQQAAKMKEELAAARCEGTAGSGLVTVVVTGDQHVLEVRIAEGAMGDRELLEDLVRAATADALEKSRAEMQKRIATLTGGIPGLSGLLPPGLL